MIPAAPSGSYLAEGLVIISMFSIVAEVSVSTPRWGLLRGLTVNEHLEVRAAAQGDVVLDVHP